MPLVPNFSTSQSLATLSNVTFTDTSTGSDGTITTRRITVVLPNGNYLTAAGESTTPAYINWPYAQPSITVSLLSKSKAATVVVEWFAGAVSTYVKVLISLWDLYDYVYGIGLISDMTSDPDIISDKDWYSNFFKFVTNIWIAESAITYGSDTYSSQRALNVNQSMMTHSNQVF
jgi:hypothetical protein